MPKSFSRVIAYRDAFSIYCCLLKLLTINNFRKAQV